MIVSKRFVELRNALQQAPAKVPGILAKPIALPPELDQTNPISLT